MPQAAKERASGGDFNARALLIETCRSLGPNGLTTAMKARLSQTGSCRFKTGLGTGHRDKRAAFSNYELNVAKIAPLKAAGEVNNSLHAVVEAKA